MSKMMDYRQSEAFNVHLKGADTMEIRISELINDQSCLAFLEQFKDDITAPNLAVAASLFIKRYARLVAVPVLTSVGVDRCALSLPLQACYFTHDKKLRVDERLCQRRTWKQSEREELREILVKELFALHITPLVAVLKRTTNIRESILWENVAVRVNPVYREALLKDEKEENRRRMISDFHFLKEAPGDLFSLDKNPLRPYLHLPVDDSISYRETCCLYHRLEKDSEGIGFCLNCPTRGKLAARQGSGNGIF